VKEKAKISKVRVYGSIYNALNIIDHTKKYGLDPENASVEHYGYPNERIFAVSLNLGF
jgi:hypothetical protein